MSITIDTVTKLFAHKKEEIQILGSAGKFTNTSGPAGLGVSSCRGASVKKTTPAKYSGLARILDYIIVTPSVNGLCTSASITNDAIYGEVMNEGKQYRFVCDDGGKKITYEGERLHGYFSMIPLVLYALRNGTLDTEFYDSFIACKNSFNSLGVAETQDVLLSCDSFYYGIAKRDDGAVEVFENEASVIQEVEAGIRSGYYESIQALEDISIPALSVKTYAKRAKKAAAAKANNFDKLKEGEKVINYEWEEKQQLKIPSLKSLDDFVPSGTYYNVVNKINKRLNNVIMRMDGGLEGIDAIGKDYVNLFITGKPGTGKTTLAYAVGAALQMPVYTVAMTKNTEEDVFEGMTKVVDGKVSFVETDFLYAYTHGGVIILEEINLPDPSVVMGSIGQAVEFPFVLLENGCKPVRRHPMCVIIGTMNIGTFGSKGVNQALSSRFKQSYILNDPNKNDFIDILAKQGNTKKDCTWVYNAYDKITNYLKSPNVNAEDICLNVTLRGCIGALENMSEGEPAKDAIRNTLIGKISEVDLELAEDVYKNVVQTLPEN